MTGTAKSFNYQRRPSDVNVLSAPETDVNVTGGEVSVSDGLGVNILNSPSVTISGTHHVIVDTLPTIAGAVSLTSKTPVLTRVKDSAALGNKASHKASPGDVTKFWGKCGATATYLQLYNQTSVPNLAVDTPTVTYPILALEKFSESFIDGLKFSTGIAFAFTTDADGTTGSAASAISAFMLIGT
jgi:hypothetical protein